MAAITHPRALRFRDNNARVIAEQALSLYRTIGQFQTLLVENFENLTGANANGDTIGESENHVLHPITKENVAQLKFVIEQLEACFDTDDRVAILSRWAVNSSPYF